MQHRSLDAADRQDELRNWPYRACVGDMITAMAADGYSARVMRKSAQAAERFIAWLAKNPSGHPLDFQALDRFVVHRTTLGELRPGEVAALQRLHAALVAAEVVVAPPQSIASGSPILRRYEASLRRRGYRDRSIASHLWFIGRFIEGVDSDAALDRLTGSKVLGYIERHARDRRTSTAAIRCSRIRVFLRFLQAEALVAEDLSVYVPSARVNSSSGLPSHLPPADVEAVLACCDRTTVAGRRDYAILLLLARLGLRAGEVAALTLDDVDWRTGVLHVLGKGGRTASMPMFQDVGAALAEYIREGRPPTLSRTIFHRVQTPCTAFTSATPVSLVARRALQRAGIQGVANHHAHVFRHSLATGMIRSGASLTEIGQVLRHQSMDTTRIYAKVDVSALRSLSFAWPEGGQ